MFFQLDVASYVQITFFKKNTTPKLKGPIWVRLKVQ